MNPLFLVFDTETTGLPSESKLAVRYVENWPHIVQLAWLVYDVDGNLLKKQNLYIRPDHFNIPKESIQIHKITEEFAFKNGVTIAEAILEFTNDLKQVDYVVGHNVNFDIAMIQVEWVRTKVPYDIFFQFVTPLCTGLLSRDYLKLPGKDPAYNKFPSLKELHYFLFEEDFVDAHNALVDSEITAKCFWELVDREIIKI